MELVKRKKDSVVARCEACGREIEIPYSNTIRPHMHSIELKAAVQCPCGEYHNLIIETETTPSKPQSQEEQPIKCPRCGSTQLHAGDKGFSVGKAVTGGLLFGGIGLLGGFIGSKKIVITCLKCGYKWQVKKI